MTGWRDYEDSDFETVCLLHAKLEDRIGRSLDMPNLSERPTLIAMVYENEHGIVTNVVYSEAEMEIAAAGEGGLSAEDFAPVKERFENVARYYGIRIARAFVPRSVLTKPNGKPSAIKRLLESPVVNFTEDTGEVAPFFYWVKPAAVVVADCEQIPVYEEICKAS